ncbi:RdgB/HAM1 family non-canonical purine NTP pyrophosphatase [Patescibacteria group bacterium]|nr:RdgB/HAM1 family non-canonical purine NTP pyrophosphatase [Patescibacteria group bacterium]
MNIFIASANDGKIKEIKAILANNSLNLLSILDTEQLNRLGLSIDQDFDVIEDGKTFQDNALLKAKAYADLTKMPVIADDSGLEVEALDGFPSVNSNRWFDGTVGERNLALLDLLKDKKNRQARFYSVICYFDPANNEANFFDGEIKGQIALEPKGSKIEGFGYDPIFIPEGFDKSFAELGAEFKNTISHRRKALSKLSQYVLQDKHLEQPE